MKTYSQFKPTQFDDHIHIDGKEDWIVAPCSQTRDSDNVEKSNFATCLEILGGESDTVEVHRFRHWGPGWYEIIICHPSKEKELQSIVDRLEDYPLLDEEDHSQRQYEEYEEAVADLLSAWPEERYAERLSVITDQYGFDTEEIYGKIDALANELKREDNEAEDDEIFRQGLIDGRPYMECPLCGIIRDSIMMMLTDTDSLACDCCIAEKRAFSVPTVMERA